MVDDPGQAGPIAESVAAPGSFHPDGVNTPRGLKGAPLAVWDFTLKLQRFVLVVCGALLTVLIAVQVFTRYVMGISIFGIEELATFVAVYLYFVGAAHGAWERGHITASLVELIVPEGTGRNLIAVVAGAITVVLSGWMTVWAVQYLLFTIGRGTMSLEVGISLVWVIAIIPIGLGLMTLYFTVELFDRLTRLRGAAA